VVVGSVRLSLKTAAHYGQSRFRSVTIAVCFILTGQMHAIASFTSAGGSNKRLSFDPAVTTAIHARTLNDGTPARWSQTHRCGQVSYYEMKIHSWLEPLIQHEPSGGAFFFATFLETAL
jgi:hypothetical protein